MEKPSIESLQLELATTITKLESTNRVLKIYKDINEEQKNKLELYKKNSGNITDTSKKIFLRTFVGTGKSSSGKEFEICIGSVNCSPIVQYKNKYFTLSWEQILSLAELQGLFEEDANEQENI